MVRICAATLVMIVGLAAPRHVHGESSPSLHDDVRQLLVAIAPDWNAPRALLRRYERDTPGSAWRPLGEPVPILLGGKGLAWGRGVLGNDTAARRKREGDGRAPAGVFALGTIYTYDAALPEGADYPFRQITAADAWIDDPAHPLYNQHVVVDLKDPPPWFEQHKMRHGDPAYRWLLEVRHNADPPEPDAGSAIFLHLRRGPNRTTAGCSALAEPALAEIITWLRADAHPHYALLPRGEYEQRWAAWHLPPPFGPAPATHPHPEVQSAN